MWGEGMVGSWFGWVGCMLVCLREGKEWWLGGWWLVARRVGRRDEELGVRGGGGVRWRWWGGFSCVCGVVLTVGVGVGSPGR